MQLIIDYARAEGLHAIEGQVLRDNATMLAMCRELGFDIATDAEDPDTCVVKLAVTH
jgi:acetyltransferase